MFENRIRERRQELGLSQTKLAHMVGIAGSSLSNLELGKWKPWPKVRRDLAKALNMTEQALFDSGVKDSIENINKIMNKVWEELR
ncbi:helix-turn-helix transcriptional regulator [Chloroflexota bacterium]